MVILLALLKSKGYVRIAYKAVLRVDVMSLPCARRLTRRVAQVTLDFCVLNVNRKKVLENRTAM